MPPWTARFVLFLSLSLLIAVPFGRQQARPAAQVGDLAALPVKQEPPPLLGSEELGSQILGDTPAPSTTAPIPTPAPAPTPSPATPDSQDKLAQVERLESVITPSAATAAPAATPMPTPTPLVSADQVYPARLADLPAASATPVRLQIDAIRLDAKVVNTGFRADTTELAVPDDAKVAGWYAGGVEPGEDGTALIAGHVDLVSGVSGPFFKLGQVKPEMEVVVDFSDGSRRTFVVVARQSYPRDELPVDRILASQGEPLLALITCGGHFDRTAGRYTENVVVYARPAQ